MTSACGTVATAPLDDAYYWPDKKSEPAVVESTPAPTMEIVNQQDTTITIRIKE